MRLILCTVASAVLASSWADELSLDEAVAYAKDHNGRIAAAQLDYLASRSAITIANAAFWPRIIPQYRYVNQRQVPGTGDDAFNDLSVGLNWLLIDAGQRSFNVARIRKLSDASALATRNTLRDTLFTVVLQFHETLRAQELLRVADAQLERTDETLEVTKTQAEVGGVAKKEILQAEADRANAVVAKLSASNAVRAFQAALKATIGWEAQEDLPDLAAPAVPEFPAFVPALEKTVANGLAARTDLAEVRRRLEAQRYEVLAARQQSGLDWELSFNYGRSFEFQDDESRNLQFLVTYPLFDAGASREVARQANYGYEASRRLYDQQVLEARSEIESVYHSWTQNRRRLDASEVALKAAQVNFTAASESQSLGAGTIIEVTAAQLALVTAETNRVQALYDYLISEMELKLVTGAPLPGEDVAEQK